MKKSIRFMAFCMVLMMLLVALPFGINAAVSIPSNVKSVVFNADYYAHRYSDLKAAFGSNETYLYNHFLNYGIKEGRQASPMFSVDYYLNQNADLKAAFGSNREYAMNHFMAYGINETRITAPAVNVGNDVEVRITMYSCGMNIGYNGTNVETVNKANTADQYWILKRYSDGSYKITNKGTGKVLDVYAASRAPGANVGLYASNDTNAQRWYIYKNKNGSYSLRAKCGTTCALTVKDASTVAGTNVLMDTYTGNSSQQFNIQKLGLLEGMAPANLGSDFQANIRGVGSNYNLALSKDNVLIRYPNTGIGQIWRFVRSSDGSYRISNVKTGNALTCSNGLGTDGTNVHTYVSTNQNYQKWFIYNVGGNYVFAPACSTTCVLEVADDGKTSGTNVELGTYSSASTAQQFKMIKISETNSEKNLAISEICSTPNNGSFEFMEIMNVSDTAVNVNQYSLYRFSASNGGKYEFSAYYKLLGLVSPTGSDSSLDNLDKLNLSSYNVNIDPGKLAVLWFVTYEDRALTVDDFKAYWTEQGCDMTDVTVIPVAIYSGTTNAHAATNVNTGAGKGYLADYKVASAYSLIKNTALNTRLENGTTLKNFEATKDVPLAYNSVAELQNRADSIALHYVSTTAEVGSSRNFCNFVDNDNFLEKAKPSVQKYMIDYTHIYSATTYPAQVTGSNSSDGIPSAVKAYCNYSSDTITAINIGVDCGLKKTQPTPGTKWFSQFPELDLVSTTVNDEGVVTFNGSFKYNEYKKAGFVIKILHTESGEVIAKKAVTTTTFTKTKDGYTYSIDVSGLPVKDGTVVLNVVPYALSIGTGERVNGVREEIKCPIVSATIGGKSIEGLRVTYLINENNGPIQDVTGIKEAVKLLANDIEYYTGVEVKIDIYNPRADYPQIVIASSGTGSGGDAFVPAGKKVNTNQYGLFYSSGDIFAIGGSAIAAEYSSQQIAKALASATGAVELKQLCSDTIKNFSTVNNKLSLTDGATYRFMTQNVERLEINTNTARLSNFIESLRYYSPDVIGFQEYCSQFTALLTPKIKAEGYTVLGNELSGSRQNYTPLAYKTSRFTCVDKGWFVLSGETNYPGHNVTWAVLKDKVTGEIFAISTTHFYHKSDRSIANPIRAINAQEMVDFTKRIVNKYGCEVINVGDFNTYSIDDGYSVFLNSGIIVDSRYNAIRGYSPERSSHYNGTSAPRPGSEIYGIDLFLMTKNITVLRNRMPMNKTTSEAADHYPVCIDVSFP